MQARKVTSMNKVTDKHVRAIFYIVRLNNSKGKKDDR